MQQLEIKKFLQSQNDIDILDNWTDIQYHDVNLILDYHTNISWWLWLSKEQYDAHEKKINDVSVTTNDYSIHAWCDVSGYDYWVVKQEENNYIVVTVTIKNKSKDFTKEELIDLDNKVFSIKESLSI